MDARLKIWRARMKNMKMGAENAGVKKSGAMTDGEPSV